TPSLDDLIYDGSKTSADEDKSGFFGRLFGKGGKKSQAAQASERDLLPRSIQPTTPASGATPIAPVSGSVPITAASGTVASGPFSGPTPVAPASGSIPLVDNSPFSGPSPRVSAP